MIKEHNIFDGSSLKSQSEVFEFVGQKLAKTDQKISTAQVIEGLKNRESQSSTGFEAGIAIPHTKVVGLKTPVVMLVRNLDIDWKAMDGKNTNIAIAIFTPDNSSDEHLTILSNLSRKLIDESFQQVLKTGTSQEISKLLEVQQSKNTTTKSAVNIIAVTGCPTGIAHTFMAAENISKYATKEGYNVKVETRGQGGTGNELTQSDIDNADFVLICADVNVDIERFSGKKVLNKKVKAGIKDLDKLFEELFATQVMTFENKAKKQDSNTPSFYKALMNGVTHMLPFTIAGGILIALRFFFGTTGDIEAGVQPIIENLALGEFFKTIGDMLFGFMLPILAGYIAFAIGNRAALMPGILAGIMASSDGSGFLGAILGGFIAGYLAKFLFSQLTKLPKSIQGSYQILFMPLIAAIAIGLFMTVFAYPVGALNIGMQNGLAALEDFNPLILGALVGAMMATDMGGPINKAAYVTGTLLLAEGNQTFMAAVMAGGMVPPLAIALSTIVHKSIWTKDQIEAGKTNWILGLSFITEGAIPFAAANPKQVIPALMIGSGVAGSLTMMFGITLPAPHGGLFVFPLVNNPLMYLIAIIVGSVVSMLCLSVFKKAVK